MLIFFILHAFADIPSGSTISEAAYLDIPPNGFASFATVIPELIPPNTPVDPTAGGGEGLGCSYAYNLDNMWVAIEVDSTTVTPQDGYLSMDLELLVNVNDLVDRFAIDFNITSCGFFDSESTCYGFVTSFPAIVQSKIALALVDPDGDGIKELDATIYDLTLEYAVDANNFEIECLAGSILDALSWIGVDVYSFVIDLIGPTLENEIYEQLPELEATIEEAFSNAVINEEIEVGESAINMLLSPEILTIQQEGLRFSFDGRTEILEEASCINDYDSGGSIETEGSANEIGVLQVPSDLGIAIRDEFVNQALYSIWKGGSFCQTIDEDTFALDTSILNLLTGDSFVPLFPETKPMILKMDPRTAPTMSMNSADDIGVNIEDLQLQFISELDYRQTQVLTLSLDTQAGLNLNFDPNTGAAEGALNLDPDEVTSSIVSNELRPDEDQIIIQAFSDQFGSVLDLVGLDALLDSLNFTLPSINGIGVNQIELGGTGTTQSDLGIYASIGPVPYTGGCGEGEESSGGCTTTKTPTGKHLLFVMVLALGCLRRRAT
jgi:hypothetical protein